MGGYEAGRIEVGVRVWMGAGVGVRVCVGVELGWVGVWVGERISLVVG